MTTIDQINRYLATKTHKSFMELGGIDYFIRRWEKTCEEIPYGTNYYMIDEHVNDLRFRYTIDEVLKLFTLPKELSKRLKMADSKFKEKSVEIDRCILSTRAESLKKLNRTENWYYYNLPQCRFDEWMPML